MFATSPFTLVRRTRLVRLFAAGGPEDGDDAAAAIINDAEVEEDEEEDERIPTAEVLARRDFAALLLRLEEVVKVEETAAGLREVRDFPVLNWLLLMLLFAILLLLLLFVVAFKLLRLWSP